jgi:hypothetical protein
MAETLEEPAPIGVLISVPWDLDHLDLETGEWVKRRYVMPVVNWWICLDFRGACHGAN